MIERLFQLSASIRYVAVYRDGRLESRSRAHISGASSSQSDRYEELLVNPALLKLTSQRGNIDCGGLDYLVVRYGNFFQYLLPTDWGHVSVSMEADADPIQLGDRVRSLVHHSQGKCIPSV